MSSFRLKESENHKVIFELLIELTTCHKTLGMFEYIPSLDLWHFTAKGNEGTHPYSISPADLENLAGMMRFHERELLKEHGEHNRRVERAAMAEHLRWGRKSTPQTDREAQIATYNGRCKHGEIPGLCEKCKEER